VGYDGTPFSFSRNVQPVATTADLERMTLEHGVRGYKVTKRDLALPDDALFRAIGMGVLRSLDQDGLLGVEERVASGLDNDEEEMPELEEEEEEQKWGSTDVAFMTALLARSSHSLAANATSPTAAPAAATSTLPKTPTVPSSSKATGGARRAPKRPRR